MTFNGTQKIFFIEITIKEMPEFHSIKAIACTLQKRIIALFAKLTFAQMTQPNESPFKLWFVFARNEYISKICKRTIT